MALLALSSCSKKPLVARPVEPCLVRKLPPALLFDPQVCGDQACLSIQEMIDIAYYITITEERNLDLARCPYIKDRPDD